MVIKYCFVPSCNKDSKYYPKKLFIRLPKNLAVRKRWYEAIYPNILILDSNLSKTSMLFCCEDHFDLEKDAENWTYYKLMGRKITLKKDVVPHIFEAKKEESSSQFTDAEKELKRTLLEQYKNDRLNQKKSNVATATTSNFDCCFGINVVEVNKNLLANAKSSDYEENSNDSTSSNEANTITPEETIVPSRINIQIDPGLPELMYIREESPERHQPLLLRRKNKNNKSKNGPEVVWINPPMVEISSEDQLEKSIKNAGSLENEEQLGEAKLLKIKSETNLLEIKSEIELGEIKQEETHIEDFNVEDNTENYLYSEINMDISHRPDSVQAYLNVDSQPKDLPVSGIELKTEATNITIKEEPLEQTNDFEFVSVNIKQESSFFCEDALPVPGRSIYVAKQTDESILS